MTTAVMFAGQGSQRPGMAADLLGRYTDLEREASEVLGYSMRDLCLHDPDRRLADTRYTQPALYVVNAMSWQAARDDGLSADVLLGHSVGEYAALLAAGVFDFTTGLALVAERGRVMATVAGGMCVVLGLDAATIEAVLRDAGLAGVDLANLNATDQIVLAGPTRDLAQAVVPLTAAGAFAVRPLDVSGPFHSHYMRPAARAFARAVSGVPLAPPRTPVIANRTAQPYPASGIARLLVEQIDHQVRWADSLAHLLALDPAAEFVELGAAPTLAGTVRRARQAMVLATSGVITREGTTR
jgi:trans-AT polyketide synthase/acyltransferase/oxidoreductase domain-containing protein